MEKTRFTMLTRWLTFMAFLAVSANPRSAGSDRRAATVAPTCRVKGQPEVELILNCGDGEREGWVQLWHTPFGDLQPSSGHTYSVFVHHNGSLVVRRPSLLHSGLYYCVLQHPGGSTLWPYELRVGHIDRSAGDEPGQDHSCAAHRTGATIRTGEAEVGVSDATFAGAVVASVLVTFGVGFSAGALMRSYVLRCWHAITTRLRSPKRRRHHRRQADVPDHSSQVVITTLPPMTRESHAFETETTRDGSPVCGSVGNRESVTTPSPPAKPKRSFRNREGEKTRDAAYLEGCDYTKERMEEAGGGVGAVKEGSDEEEETTQSFFYLEDEELRSETDEDKISDEREEEERSEEEKTETERCEELEQSPAGAERGGGNKEVTTEEEEVEPSSAPRRRVIRVYQYDEEGQRYCHLPDPGPEGPEPVPKLKQRSLSLTRLNAIMAAAAAGPVEASEGEERPHFHMEI